EKRPFRGQRKRIYRIWRARRQNVEPHCGKEQGMQKIERGLCGNGGYTRGDERTQRREETVLCGDGSALCEDGYIQCRDRNSHRREVRVQSRDVTLLTETSRQAVGRATGSRAVASGCRARPASPSCARRRESCRRTKRGCRRRSEDTVGELFQRCQVSEDSGDLEVVVPWTLETDGRTAFGDTGDLGATGGEDGSRGEQGQSRSRKEAEKDPAQGRMVLHRNRHRRNRPLPTGEPCIAMPPAQLLIGLKVAPIVGAFLEGVNRSPARDAGGLSRRPRLTARGLRGHQRSRGWRGFGVPVHFAQAPPEPFPSFTT